jgi:phosphoglycolate phosphatase-like HAD superfamily hydrolase
MERSVNILVKKNVFFDGDGTLWYPQATRRTREPHWIYQDPTLTNPCSELIVTPHAIDTLAALGGLGITRVLLSSCPLPENDAIIDRSKIAKHIKIHGLLDAIRVAPDREDGKSEQLLSLLDEFNFTPDEALMVGDTCDWDYVAAQNVGI